MILLNALVVIHIMPTTSLAMTAYGYCIRCQEQHSIPTTAAAKRHAQTLRETLESTGRLDFERNTDDNVGDPLLDVSCLYNCRGKMFGVLVAEDQQGNEVVLKAFAGKIRSYGWKLDGWVDPIVVPEEIPRFVELRDEVSRVTFEMEKCFAAAAASTHNDDAIEMEQWKRLKSERSSMSRDALEVLREEQWVGNFRGETSSLSKIFLHDKELGVRRTKNQMPAPGGGGGDKAKMRPRQMPVGVGECCATKLVQAASEKNLKPTGIAEFFVGHSKNRRVDDGIFYDSCAERCQKVLGFMLCGLPPVLS